MLNVKRSTLGAVCAAALALGLAMGLAACAPKTADSVKGSSSGSSAATSQVAGDGTGAYVSDEQCLSCHGGSYEALAEKTAVNPEAKRISLSIRDAADYGDSNPHDSIHGGYSSCVNCHAKDREITDNQCMHCHDWPHNPGA